MIGSTAARICKGQIDAGAREAPRDPSRDRGVREFNAALGDRLDDAPIRQLAAGIRAHARLEEVRIEGSLAILGVGSDWVPKSGLRHGSRMLHSETGCIRTA
jgi:hypothetical protein